MQPLFRALPRRKVFISYHHADQAEVNSFIDMFDRYSDVFIARGLGVDIESNLINSWDTDYVMRRIRELYLQDSTVTAVLIGECTWARRYVDWEIQASLRRSLDGPPPNGLLGIVLPTAQAAPRAPARLLANLAGPDGKDGYARWWVYPDNAATLATWIEEAYSARFRHPNLIVNERDRFSNDRTCPEVSLGWRS